MNVSVDGLFSLPEVWKSKMEDPADAIYSYEARLLSTHFKAGRIVQRELTEEEKAEAEATKGKKPVAEKAAKGKAKNVAEEEPSAEEVERLERETREREDSNDRLRSEWDALDENTKFFRHNEDPFKGPSIRFLQSDLAEEAPPANQQTLQLDGAALRSFESAVCDDKFCWIYFDKLVPQDDENEAPSKAKKPAAKGKAPATAEEAKPTHARGRLDLTPLMHPGATMLIQRVFLQTCNREDANLPPKPNQDSIPVAVG